MKLIDIERVDELEKIYKILKNNSVVEIIKKLEVKCFNVHRRTQEMVRRIINATNEAECLERRRNQTVVDKFDISQSYDKKEWNISKLLVPNIFLALKSKYVCKEQLVNIYNKLGTYYSYVMVDYDLAKKYQEDSLSLNYAIYGPNENNPAIATSLNQLAASYAGLGKFQESLKFSLRSLDMNYAIYGPNENNPAIATSLNNIGEKYYNLGEFPKSLEFHLKSLAMRYAIYGQNENSPAIASSLNNVARTYNKLGHFQKGLEFNLRALAMQYAIYGQNENNPQIATSLNNVFSTYYYWGSSIKEKFKGVAFQFNKKAIEYQIKSIQMLEVIFNHSQHPHLAVAYTNLGQIYVETNDVRNALKFILKGIIMQLEIEGKV
jgi:tetratricopeptide (TPR) repeat protein